MATQKGSRININSSTIIWTRKHMAPSIPCRGTGYGYEENKTGTLVPKCAPKMEKCVETVPVSKSRAHKFFTSSLPTMKIQEGPGPVGYNITESKTSRAASIGRRLTPAKVNSAAPGPGSYSPALIQTRKGVSIALQKISCLPVNDSQPGPANYTPNSKRTIDFIAKPFGSTSARFSSSEYTGSPDPTQYLNVMVNTD